MPTSTHKTFSARPNSPYPINEPKKSATGWMSRLKPVGAALVGLCAVDRMIGTLAAASASSLLPVVGGEPAAWKLRGPKPLSPPPVGRHLTAASSASLPFVHPYFSDGTVLQSGSGGFFGWESAGTKVTAALSGPRTLSPRSAVADSSGRWNIDFGDLGGGGPYQATLRSARHQQTLRDVYFGDVFLLSGQSNAARTLNNIAQDPLVSSAWHKKAAAEVAQADNRRIHLLRLTQNYQTAPAKVFLTSTIWFTPPANRTNLNNFSALGYLFAKNLQPKIGGGSSHVAVVHAAVSGTSLHRWISAQANAKLSQKVAGSRQTELYNGMIAPMAGLKYKAVLWYQGENEARSSAQTPSYQEALGGLVADWRRQFNQPQLPFLIVGLAGYKSKDTNYWAEIREAQRRVAAQVGGLVTTADCSLSNTIHPPNKFDLGSRAARAARALVYGQGVHPSGPNFSSVSFHGGNAIVSFSEAASGLMNAVKGGTSLPVRVQGDSIAGFEVQDSAGAWHPARSATLVGSSVHVSSSVTRAINVRYGWKDYPALRLYGRGSLLPAAPFSTAKNYVHKHT